eukprot:4354832-Alexandrium_andersonii.AAC.1
MCAGSPTDRKRRSSYAPSHRATYGMSSTSWVLWASGGLRRLMQGCGGRRCVGLLPTGASHAAYCAWV